MAMSPFIPTPTRQKMARMGISEGTVLDVFNNGEYKPHSSGSKMMIKKYSGYEVGLFFEQSAQTGEYSIYAVWTRDRK